MKSKPKCLKDYIPTLKTEFHLVLVIYDWIFPAVCLFYLLLYNDRICFQGGIYANFIKGTLF